MAVADQVQYETRVRFRYAVVAFVAALLTVVSQLLLISGVHTPVNELTLDLITQDHRRGLDIVGGGLDMLSLFGIAILLFWMHRISQARRPEIKSIMRYVAVAGALLAAVMAISYTVVIAHKAQEFVSAGNQGYPEANHLTDSGFVVVLPLLLELGTLLLAIGCIWTSLSAMRVGLVTRMVGYAGVIAGALFLFPIQGLVPIVQGFWLAAVAVTLSKHWPSGDPPAWKQGIAIPWNPLTSQPPAQPVARPARGQRRRKVSDSEVLAAVDEKKPANPQAGRRKRKRRS